MAAAISSAIEPIHKLLDLAFRQRPHEAINSLTVDEGEHRRDRLHPHLARQLLVLVDVDLDHLHLAVGGLHHLFKGWPQLLAWPAPRRPEINDHRLRA
jgi:hypothetical protein